MYAGHFGLDQAPFSIAPDPRYLYMSERHREALAHLLYGIEAGGGFVVLSGEIGAGKTTICRCFLEQIPPHCHVAYVFNPQLTVAELLRTVCHELHIDVPRDSGEPPSLHACIEHLNEHLLRSHAAGQHNLLIIDEAQNLAPHVLEQLRLLTNLETRERKLLQIILIGQPELRQLLARPELEQLAQRVIARFHLGALDEAETRQYVHHRMAVAGLKGPLPFSEAALQRVRTLSRGLPRRINLLCDRALLGAYAGALPRVERAVVERAAAEVFDSTVADSSVPPADRPARRLGSLALGALGGAVSAAAVLGLWLAPSAPPPAAPTGQPAPGASVPAPALAQTPTVAAADRGSASAPVHGLPPADALLRSEAAGLRELGPLWGAPLPDDDPCVSATRQRLQCFRTTRMTLSGLQQMDRPAVLQIQLPGHTGGWAVLVALHAGSATLRIGERQWSVPLTALADTWRGDYATLWRLPPDLNGRLAGTGADPGTGWLADQLQALQVEGKVAADASDGRARVRAFQQTQGLDSDGLAGPMTLMLLNRAVRVTEPRLLSSAHTEP